MTKESPSTNLESDQGNDTQAIPTHPNLIKYIADNLVIVMGAIVKETGVLKPMSPLKRYDFQKAKLSDAYWSRVDARGVDFYQASFHNVSLRNSYLSEAVFYQADLSHTVLTQADLRGANLYGANLEGANLEGANLEDANLEDANLEDANLEDANLEGAKYDQNTTWPVGFDPEAAGAIWVGEGENVS